VQNYYQGDAIEVPDSITPVVGYRTWQVSGGGSRLKAIAHPAVWEPGRNRAKCAGGYAPANWLNGDEDHDARHAAPLEGCSCGWYAMRTLEGFVHDFIGGYTYSADVAGKVAMWGKVIEGERGYRAQYAKVVELLAQPDDPKLYQLLHLAEVYDASVSFELYSRLATLEGGPLDGKLRVIPPEAPPLWGVTNRKTNQLAIYEHDVEPVFLPIPAQSDINYDGRYDAAMEALSVETVLTERHIYRWVKTLPGMRTDWQPDRY
jgi:hypothetical protein